MKNRALPYLTTTAMGCATPLIQTAALCPDVRPRYESGGWSRPCYLGRQ